MAKSKRDPKLISNTLSEITTASKTLNVDPIMIHLAKRETKSNDREVIYSWISQNLGNIISVKIEHLPYPEETADPV